MPEGSARSGAGDERPHVIFILTDDQGPWAAGCCGNPEIRTPNIDSLARSGVLFTNFFVATPVCSPSRATFLTGRIPSQHGIHEWVYPEVMVGPQAKVLIGDEVGYTDVMAEHGYVCGISGKWHLGDCLKPTHSFSFWYVHQLGGGPYNNAPMVRAGRPINEPGYVTDRITDEALNFIDAHAQDARPFYLSVHYTAPHSPWTGHPQDIVDSYDGCPFLSCPQEPRHPWAGDLTTRCLGNREMLKGYFAAVTAMDANVGRILRRLEELGLTERTLVIFVSDNGFSCGHHGFWGKGNGTHPRNMYENSIKVPFIVSRPGGLRPAWPAGARRGDSTLRSGGDLGTASQETRRVAEGRRVDAMVSAYDFFPTLLDYLDLPLPEGRNLPGRSFLPLLTGRADRVNDKVVVFDEYGPVRMIRTEEWKYVGRHPDGPHDLYHLTEDPDERRNLADDPAYNKVKAELKAEMEAWFARYVTAEHDGLRETY